MPPNLKVAKGELCDSNTAVGAFIKRSISLVVLLGYRPPEATTPRLPPTRLSGIRPGVSDAIERLTSKSGKSTATLCYRKGRAGNRDSGGSPIPWNKLRPEEESKILAQARASPEISARQLALRIADTEGSYVSESTVFRILKREGLIKPAEVVGFKAGKEYHRKTKKPNELWATDCAHLKVVDWGWYYLVTVMDDFSRFILAWELKSDMAAGSLIDVVQKAVDSTGMTDVPLEDRTVLLSDNGPGYLSRQFNDYLRLVGIRHVIASPYHPQTNGKLERYHRTIKGEIYLLPYEMLGELKEAVKAFIEYYNYQRYHEGLGDVTPYDAYTGRHLEVIQRRKEAKNRTLSARKSYNRAIREQGFRS